MIDVYENFELTKDNHLKYWFNQNTSQHWRQSPYDTAHMSCLPAIPAADVPFLTTLSTTAKAFGNKHATPLNIFLSGGLDSEVACRAFISAGIPFKTTILRFNNELNIEDVSNAIAFCQQANIVPTVMDIDPIAFLHSNEWRRIAIDYQCYTFYQQMLLWVAEKISEPIMTVDEIELVKSDNLWYFSKKEDQDGCWHRFIEKTGIPAYNNFYTYDPATMLAFMKNDTIRKLTSNQIFGKLSWASSKNEVYQQLTGWEMTRRPKRFGIERMRHAWDWVENAAATLLHDEPCKFMFESTELYASLRNGGPITCNTI